MSTAPLSPPQVSTENRQDRRISCSVDQLQPHPGLARLHIVLSVPEHIAALRVRCHGIDQPITITDNQYILAGHLGPRWRVKNWCESRSWLAKSERVSIV